ncbi:MAG: gfo/Idh/MocA family oxidoreductase, partial [Deltaproteobacteria bacterium]|nr:gfo/Idh/MocA family oxidoreductase [Deltaproteobacteria bacterium]
AAGVPIITDKADIVNARIRFKNGCVANVTASRVSMEPQRRMRLFQSDAYIAIDFAKQHITILRRMMEEGRERPSLVSEELNIESKDTLLEEIVHFLECSATRKEPLVSGRDGRRALEAAVRVQESVFVSMERFKEHMGCTV